MPAIAPQDIVQALLDAVQDSGGQAHLTSCTRAHPRKFRVVTPMEAFDLWVYIWTLTPGGRANLPNEFRIQKTGVSSPLPLNPAGPTIIAGYHAGLGVFAGFDLEHHRTFTTGPGGRGSPSAQVGLDVLNRALQFGLSFGHKDNNEIPVGFRPDYFLAYVRNAAVLHREGANARMLDALARASALEPVPEDELQRLSGPRKRIVQEVSRLARDANFRDMVMNAYGRRCAVSRVQLKLVDAAHILPVGADGSTDAVQNGIALSPTYHRAFDQGLIYLSPDHKMLINPAKVAHLRALSLDGGLETLSVHVKQVIHLPADHQQRPSVRFIREANVFRGIAA